MRTARGRIGAKMSAARARSNIGLYFWLDCAVIENNPFRSLRPCGEKGCASTGIAICESGVVKSVMDGSVGKAVGALVAQSGIAHDRVISAFTVLGDFANWISYISRAPRMRPRAFAGASLFDHPRHESALTMSAERRSPQGPLGIGEPRKEINRNRKTAHYREPEHQPGIWRDRQNPGPQPATAPSHNDGDKRQKWPRNEPGGGMVHGGHISAQKLRA